MFFAMLMFGEPGAEIVYPNPGFPIYESADQLLRRQGRALRRCWRRTTSPSTPRTCWRAITPRTRLLILNSPANPTGGAVPQGASSTSWSTASQRHPQVAVLSDEIYSRITYDGVEHTSLLTYPELEDRLILLDGWSKTYAMTGWRLGYGVWPESLVERAIAPGGQLPLLRQRRRPSTPASRRCEGPQDAVARWCAAFDERRHVIVEASTRSPA